MQLKNGATTEDPRLDRVPQFDERSRRFPVRTMLELVEAKKPRSYTWRLSKILDQGREGACVGHGWAHELLCRPAVAQLADPSAMAFRIYREAQKIDAWPGEAYEGTSVLAGAKIVQQLGGMREYRWCFSLDDLVLTLGYLGPVVVGVNWYSGMFDTDSSGMIHASGSVMGGHCVAAIGVSTRKRYVEIANSWGTAWGNGGFARISFDDLGRLLAEDGEACVPLVRQKLVRQKLVTES